MAKNKFYVVWVGHKPGIYNDWAEAKTQISGCSNPRYKGYASLSEAEEAFASGVPSAISSAEKGVSDVSKLPLGTSLGSPLVNAVAVDAACSGNPGVMEYRGVSLWDGKEFFRHKHNLGTNNIGEFLAIVEALARLKNAGAGDITVYSDSTIAIGWVRRGTCRTKLIPTPRTNDLFDIVKRAELWLAQNTFSNPIVKWPTEVWGEIPADFGRK